MLRTTAARSPILLAQSFVGVSAPADTTEDVLATITVPANTLGANGALRITTVWTTTSSANNKTLRVRYSGGSGTAYLTQAFTAVANVVATTIIGNVNAVNSQFGISGGVTSAGGVLPSVSATSAVDTTASTTVVITGQKALGSETLTLSAYVVEVMR